MDGFGTLILFNMVVIDGEVVCEIAEAGDAVAVDEIVAQIETDKVFLLLFVYYFSEGVPLSSAGMIWSY